MTEISYLEVAVIGDIPEGVFCDDGLHDALLLPAVQIILGVRAEILGFFHQLKLLEPLLFRLVLSRKHLFLSQIN